MIYIDRSKVPTPRVLLGSLVAQAKLRVENYFSLPISHRRLKHFEFPSVFSHSSVKAALAELFNRKCAYCESKIDVEQDAEVEHFRPLAGALGLERDFAPDHYYWLAYDWFNLYPACKVCNSLKGEKFPVLGHRSYLRADITTLRSETRLLLDPCHDNPFEHLKFNSTGFVSGITEQGRITIDVFGLNRSTLVQKRRAEADKVNELIRSIWMLTGCGNGVVRTAATFAIDALGEFLNASLGRVPSKSRHSILESVSATLSPVSAYYCMKCDIVDSWLRKRGWAYTSTRSTAQSLSTKESRTFANAKVRVTELSTVRIQSITLRDFRGINHLQLNYKNAASESPWLMLLGENGTGKSSVLQAVALVLAGNRVRKGLNLDPREFIRHGAKKAMVEIKLLDRQNPIALDITSKGFFGNLPDPKVLLLGYGATRLLPKIRVQTHQNIQRVRIKNLFEPFEPLIDAQRWSLGLDNATFDYNARKIMDVLCLTGEMPFIQDRRNRRICLRQFSCSTPLNALSDGYQSIVGFVLDLICGLRVEQKQGGLDSAEGIVLLDEMGAHLHPTWRVSIVSGLRKAFPRVQFLTSTHDPLCLRGVTNDEAVVLHRSSSGQIFQQKQLPRIEAMHIDQILTSEFFSLKSTIDPVVQAKFADYYNLLAIRNPNYAQKQRILELRKTILPLRQSGTTRRERLLLQVIDTYLAHTEKQPEALSEESFADSIVKRLLSHLQKT